LISHLLSFSRQQMLLPTSLELPPLLTELSHTLTRTIGRDIAVIVDVAPDLPPVFADAAHLDSALLNLALNARDAMPQGGDLRIGAYGRGEKIVITVCDTGAGMPPHVLAQACEPFFSTKGVNGSGLGLAMVQGFASQSGGELSIQSSLGHGTRIEIALPMAVRNAASPLIHKASRLSGQGRVLVVDDDPDVARVIMAFLKSAGFDVTTAMDGDEALAELNAGDMFDALVTDYAMPGMSGMDLVLQAHELHPTLPALVITGYGGSVRQDTLPGNVMILHKPFRQDDLVRKIKTLIETRLLSS
jgi:CheY-like chemotaxis protein